MKGFTLIEMIAVLIITALIATFAGFSIINMQKTITTQEKEKKLETIYMAVESYILEQNLTKNFKQENMALFISINDLIIKGYIDSNILSDDLDINIESTVKVSLNNDGTYNYNFNSINIKNYINSGLIMYINGYNKDIEIPPSKINNWMGNHFELNNVTYDISVKVPLTISVLYKIEDSLLKLSDESDNIKINNGTLYIKNYTNSIDDSKIISDTITISSNTIKRYINGSLVYEQEYTGSINDSTQITLNGEIYNMLIYKRELSSNEISHNYLVDKGRFYEDN